MPSDNLEEMFYLVDTNDQVIGSIKRSEAHKDKNKIHRAIFILITNSKQQILLQKRSLKKTTDPGWWGLSVGGHVTYGESYEEAATRELAEELDIHSELQYVDKLLLSDHRETEFDAIFLTSLDETPQHFDKDEVDEVKWVNLSELPAFLQAHPFNVAGQAVLKKVGYLPENYQIVEK